MLQMLGTRIWQWFVPVMFASEFDDPYQWTLYYLVDNTQITDLAALRRAAKLAGSIKSTKSNPIK